MKRSARKKTAPVKHTQPHPADAKITLLAKENPKRAGSAAHKRFALYSKHTTVAAFLKAGGTRADLRWDAEHKFINITAGA